MLFLTFANAPAKVATKAATATKSFAPFT